MAWKSASVPRRMEGVVSASSQHGRTLLEMIIVVVIISLVAAVAVPTGNSAQLHRLALSAAEVADAFRFARDEARRTRVSHGVSVDTSNNIVRVFRLDETSDPNIRVFDVYHPVTKQNYTVRLDGSPYSGVSLSGVGGQLVGSCSEPEHIAFDANGVVRCSEPSTTRINDASVELTTGDLSQSVTMDGYTGRVFVQ